MRRAAGCRALIVMQQRHRPTTESLGSTQARSFVFTTGQTFTEAAHAIGHQPGDSIMPEYRIYTIGRVGDQFIAVRSIECPDDEAAIRQAQQMVNGHSLEIWELERVIIRLDQDPTEPHL